MVTFDCSASHHDGVTLVTVCLRDLDVSTRVTVRNCLDGPVWPPRREGLPEAGWSATGFSGVLDAGSHALGYATPARPEGPPAELADAVPVPEADPVGDRSDRPADVVRDLGDPSPPGDAVPGAGTASTSSEDISPPAKQAGQSSTADTDVTAATADSEGLSDRDVSVGDAGEPAARDGAPHEPDAGADHIASLPSELGPWLAEMERRADTAEMLSAAETVPEATTAVREAGGLDGVRALAEADDERQLRLVARRARRLADRRAEASIPVETLATLA